jgi:hypothetical protein
MSATSVLEWSHSGLQVTAGWADTDRPDVRFLLIGVPNTHDSVRLDWYDGTEFAADVPVTGWLRIGTLPAREVRVSKGEIAADGSTEATHFGPTAEGILRAVAEPLAQFAQAHPDVLHKLRERVPMLNGKVPKDHGKVPKEPFPDAFALSVTEYAAAGAALGGLISDCTEAVTAGAALAALAGVSVYLTD